MSAIRTLCLRTKLLSLRLLAMPKLKVPGEKRECPSDRANLPVCKKGRVEEHSQSCYDYSEFYEKLGDSDSEVRVVIT